MQMVSGAFMLRRVEATGGCGEGWGTLVGVSLCQLSAHAGHATVTAAHACNGSSDSSSQRSREQVVHAAAAGAP